MALSHGNVDHCGTPYTTPLVTSLTATISFYVYFVVIMMLPLTTTGYKRTTWEVVMTQMTIHNAYDLAVDSNMYQSAVAIHD